MRRIRWSALLGKKLGRCEFHDLEPISGWERVTILGSTLPGVVNTSGPDSLFEAKE